MRWARVPYSTQCRYIWGLARPANIHNGNGKNGRCSNNLSQIGARPMIVKSFVVDVHRTTTVGRATWTILHAEKA